MKIMSLLIDSAVVVSVVVVVASFADWFDKGHCQKVFPKIGMWESELLMSFKARC